MAKIVRIGHYDPENLAEVAFHFGRKGDDLPVLALLQESEPNQTNGNGFTALHHAAQFDRLSVLSALLQAGANPNHINSQGVTPLMMARSAEAVRLLLNAGADVDAIGIPNRLGLKGGSTALMRAAGQGRQSVVAALLQAGADHRWRDANGHGPLLFAAHREHSETVALLLDAGAEVGFNEAVLLGDSALVRQFLADGMDLNAGAMQEALQWAAKAGQTHIVALLLDKGAAVDCTDEWGETVLMQAASYGRAETMRLLLARGANVNSVSFSGGTALMKCLQSGARPNPEGVELLLQAGADVGARSDSGWTPLMLTATWGDAAIAEKLLVRGAEPNVFTDEKASSAEGCTTANALMMAAANGHLEVVRLLLRHGADAQARNSEGTTILELLERRQHNGPKQEHSAAILALLQIVTTKTT